MKPAPHGRATIARPSRRCLPVLPGHGLLPVWRISQNGGAGAPPTACSCSSAGQRARRGRGVAVDHRRGGHPVRPVGDQRARLRAPHARVAVRMERAVLLLAADGRPVGQPLRGKTSPGRPLPRAATATGQPKMASGSSRQVPTASSKRRSRSRSSGPSGLAATTSARGCSRDCRRLHRAARNRSP